MARRKKNSPLEDAFSSLGLNNPEFTDGVTDMDDPDLGIHTADESVDDLTDNNKPADDEAEVNVDVRDDDSDIPEDVLNNINNNNDSSDDDDAGEDLEEGEDVNEENTQDPDTVEPWETQQVGAFFDAFADELGWDVDDEDKPDSIKGLIEYIGDMVEQNSTPEYADQRVAQLDAYIKNGGRFEDFYNNQSQAITYEDMDMEDESNQKAVVRDYMRLQGFDEKSINRKIERYEDADMLEEEAEDAIARLKLIHQQQLEMQQQQQEQIRIQNEAKAEQFINDLNAGINGLDNIRGISVPKEDRKALYDYITKTDADGLTQYQKDFNNNIVNNLIESAYFTMKGDALLSTATRNGKTSAADKLRTMMRHQAKNHSTYNVDDEKPPQAWEIASRYL